MENNLFIEEQMQIELYTKIYNIMKKESELEKERLARRNDNSECSFSVPEMAKIVNCSTNTAFVALGLFAEAGLVDFTKEHRIILK